MKEEFDEGARRLQDAIASKDGVDIEEIKRKLYEKLVPSGWGNKLKGFILSQEFDTILNRLIQDKTEGKRFVPGVKHMFRAFEECPYDKTRVVIIGQDPYPYIGVPDGLAFSCSFTMKPQPSLSYIFKDIEETVYAGRNYEKDPDLVRWAKQGVLLLNTAFTVNEKKPGTHYLLWRPFLVYVLDSIIWNPDMVNTVFVFMGNKAKEYSDLIPDNFHKLECSHPASAAHNQQERWDSGKIFTRINSCVNGDEIIW
jgi:uracil-DNA glycosylase